MNVGDKVTYKGREGKIIRIIPALKRMDTVLVETRYTVLFEKPHRESLDIPGSQLD